MVYFRASGRQTNRERIGMDLMLINPGGREVIYQDLGSDVTAVESPLWCRLIAGYIADRGYSVKILDAEAENLPPKAVGDTVAAVKPRLAGVITYGHHPSASTPQMAAASPLCRAIKEARPSQPLFIAGGHISALPERTMREEAVDYACKGEGPVTIYQLLQALDAGSSGDFSRIEGLVWREEGDIRQNPAPAIIKDLDADLHGSAWHLLPMEKYRAHNWQCFGDLSSRKPYASIYTTLGCPYKCAFCCINAPFGTNRYRMRNPEIVVEEIDYLYHRYGVKTFKIIDEMFVLNDRHVDDICRRLAAKPYTRELNFWAYARVDTVKPNRLEIDLDVSASSEISSDVIIKYRDAKKRLQDAFAALKLANVSIEERALGVDQKGQMMNPYYMDTPPARKGKVEVQLKRKLVVSCREILQIREIESAVGSNVPHANHGNTATFGTRLG